MSLNTAIGGIGQLNGKYLISAKLVLGTQDAFAIVHCWLTGKGTLLDEAYATVNGPGGGLTTISLTGVENSNNFLFTALVSCMVPSGGYAKNFVITATKVGDVAGLSAGFFARTTTFGSAMLLPRRQPCREGRRMPPL